MARLLEWKRRGIFILIFNLVLLSVTLLADGSQVVIDDFSAYDVKKFPIVESNEWRIFSLTNFQTDVYFVDSEDNNKFLRAVVRPDLERKKKAVTIIKRLIKSKDDKGASVFYMPKDYPILGWRWRVNKLPLGSDERVEDAKNQKSDSAAGVYVYFQKEGQGPHIIKFVWSEVLPVGARVVSPASKDEFQAHLVVIESGSSGLGVWHQEQVNVYDEFKKEFGEEKEPPRLLGIGILTDADSTNTEAAADYDDFILLEHN